MLVRDADWEEKADSGADVVGLQQCKKAKLGEKDLGDCSLRKLEETKQLSRPKQNQKNSEEHDEGEEAKLFWTSGW